MFKMYIDAKTFADLLKAVYVIANEAVFELAPNGVKIMAINPPHTVLVNLAFFTETPQFGDEKYRFMADVWEILKTLKKVEGMISVEYDGGNELRVSSATVEVLEPESLPQPKTSYEAKICAYAKKLKNVIEFLGSIDYHLKISASKKEVTFSAANYCACAQVKFNSNTDITVEADEEVKACYNAEYLLEIMKSAARLSDLVYVEFSTNRLARISVPIYFNAEYSSARGCIEYLIAPILET